MVETVAAKKADVEKIKVNEAKWSKPLMAAGWTAMPSVIIEKQEALGLDALDMNIIIHLSHYCRREAACRAKADQSSARTRNA
jgi:hypothetical protein